MPQFLKGALTVAGCTNAYSAILMESYFSDSKGSWRKGEPVSALGAVVAPVTQLLIHPIWWGDEHATPQDRLEEFFEASTREFSPAKRAQFDADLAWTIPAIRRTYYPYQEV